MSSMKIFSALLAYRSYITRYAETIDLLYAKQTFILPLDSQFCTWTKSIPKRNLNQIKSLVLYYDFMKPSSGPEAAQEITSILSQMPKLRKCHVILLRYFLPRGNSWGEWILSVLESVKAAQSHTDVMVEYFEPDDKSKYADRYFVKESVVFNGSSRPSSVI